MDRALPGAEIVEPGIADLEAARESIESLLVSMAVDRLRDLGYRVPEPLADPEWRLYRRLESEHGDGAHSKYNAYRRRLASFLRSAACANRSTPDESASS